MEQRTFRPIRERLAIQEILYLIQQLILKVERIPYKGNRMTLADLLEEEVEATVFEHFKLTNEEIKDFIS